jgi:hypothetical protein
MAIAFSVVRSWRAEGLGWWPRVHSTLLLIASTIFISFAWWSHLLTPSLKF